MSEAERLQKIVLEQEKQLRRLRKLMSIVRIAHAVYYVDGDELRVTVTCIGVDEYQFIEEAKPELSAIATALAGAKAELGEPEDADTGQPMDGAVSPGTTG